MKNLKLKLILPFILALFLAAVVSTSVLFYYLKQEQNNEIKDMLKHQEVVFETLSHNKVKIMEDMVQLLLTKRGLVDALEMNNQDDLLNVSTPIYNLLKNQKITHLYFIATDKKTILRVHNVKTFGDTINRFGLGKAVETGLPQQGIEMGIESNLVLRYTYPVKKDGKIIGYIEIGEEMEMLLGEISDMLGSFVTICVPKNSIDLNYYNEHKQSKDSKKYRIVGDYVIAASTLADSKIIKKEYLDKNLTMINSLNDDFFHFRKEMIDASGKVIGFAFYSQSVSLEAKDKLVNALILGTIVMGFISLLILIFYFKYIGQIDSILKIQQEELENSALTDPLTGLNNRRYLDMMIQRKMSTAKRCEKISAFFMLDIDHFKLYNDNYGHQKGDEALIKVADILKNNIKRSTDILVRMGGEEFGFFGIFENEVKMIDFGNRILQVIEDAKITHELNPKYGVITVSIGLSVSTCQENKTFEQLYKEADAALYLSKENGRNRLTLFEE